MNKIIKEIRKLYLDIAVYIGYRLGRYDNNIRGSVIAKPASSMGAADTGLHSMSAFVPAGLGLFLQEGRLYAGRQSSGACTSAEDAARWAAQKQIEMAQRHRNVRYAAETRGCANKQYCNVKVSTNGYFIVEGGENE